MSECSDDLNSGVNALIDAACSGQRSGVQRLKCVPEEDFLHAIAAIKETVAFLEANNWTKKEGGAVATLKLALKNLGAGND